MARVSRVLTGIPGHLGSVRRAIGAAARTGVFVLKVLPTLPSRPLDWVTPDPVRERVSYPTHRGPVEGEITRPASNGPHPGIVVCLGVVPFGVEHPQVPRLQEALARAGFAVLLHWSPSMRAYRLEPVDIDDLAMAYEWLVSQPSVDASRSGLFGTCVGGALAMVAASSPRIRERVTFVGAFAPYASMRTLARDITTATRLRDGAREPWAVDPLTRKVYVESLTADLTPEDAYRLREALGEPDGKLDPGSLSLRGQAVYPLLTRLTVKQAEAAIDALPPDLLDRLDAMSPLTHVTDLHAPHVVLMHDRDDPVIPQDESLRLRDALSTHPGVRYTGFVMFKHLDPTKVRLRLLPLLHELGRFYLTLYPIFRSAAGQHVPRHPHRQALQHIRHYPMPSGNTR